MPTSYAIAADSVEALWAHSRNEQPEDVLMTFLRSGKAKQYAHKHFPTLARKYKPNEIHGVLPWAYVQVGGCGKAEFNVSVGIDELLFLLMRKCGVVISGKFRIEMVDILTTLYVYLGLRVLNKI